MKDDRFIERFIHLAKALPTSEDKLNVTCKKALAPAEKRGWVWLNVPRNEWKLTREGEKIAGELAADLFKKKHRVDLWGAINRYVQTCGGDPSEKTISSERMDAVVAVETAVDAELQEMKHRRRQ